MYHSPSCVVWPHTWVVCVMRWWNHCQRHLPWIIFVHTAGFVPPANRFHPRLLTSLCHLAMHHALSVLHWNLVFGSYWQITTKDIVHMKGMEKEGSKRIISVWGNRISILQYQFWREFGQGCFYNPEQVNFRIQYLVDVLASLGMKKGSGCCKLLCYQCFSR